MLPSVRRSLRRPPASNHVQFIGVGNFRTNITAARLSAHFVSRRLKVCGHLWAMKICWRRAEGGGNGLNGQSRHSHCLAHAPATMSPLLSYLAIQVRNYKITVLPQHFLLRTDSPSSLHLQSTSIQVDNNILDSTMSQSFTYDQNVARLEAIIGYTFSDIMLGKEALTAADFRIDTAIGTSYNGNRRLAIIGGTYIKSALSDDWYSSGRSRGKRFVHNDKRSRWFGHIMLLTPHR